jgi:hypothetical protein
VNEFLPLAVNLALATLILVVAATIYTTYRRKYMRWFLIVLLLIPLLFLYALL